MKLSRKIILVIICTFIALICIAALASDIILLSSFAKLESKELHNDVQKVRNEIEESIPELEASARNYIERLQKYGPDYINGLDIGSLVNNRVDFVICYSANGTLLSARTADFHSRIVTGQSDDLLQNSQRAVSKALALNDRRLQGYLAVGSSVSQIAVRPVGNGSILMVGKYFDEGEVTRISKLTKLDLELRPVVGMPLPDDFQKALAALKDDSGFFMQILQKDRVAGYTLFADIYGQPALLLKITERRVLYEQGKVTVLSILIALITCGVVCCAVMLQFVRVTVLKRLASLSAAVRDISRSGELSVRLEVKGEDELENLAVSINTMLTSLESADNALRESESRYRVLFERAPDSIFILGTEGDEAGRIMDANNAACTQHGYTVQELRSMHIQDINTPETNEFAADLIKHILAEEWVSHEVWHLRKDGTRFPLEIHAGTIRLAGRNYILGFDRDITSRKLAEESDRMYLEQIRQLNTELVNKAQEREAANQELESFNYSVSHDLRGPLTRISGYCQLILDEEGTLDPQLKTYISRIYESCCWLDEMIDSMLKLSHLNRMEFTPAEVNMSRLAEKVVRELMMAQPEREVETVIASGVTATGDIALLKILMTNLLGNSWKYTSEAEHARIEFGVDLSGRTPVYHVRDTGAGFDMKDAAKLFRVFTRLHEHARFSGSGIGLATAQRIITRHGGRIWAEGEVGRGATFYFTLTADEDAAETITTTFAVQPQ